eukprot:110020-Pleurochrysis_carterae.AAC.2
MFGDFSPQRARHGSIEKFLQCMAFVRRSFSAWRNSVCDACVHRSRADSGGSRLACAEAAHAARRVRPGDHV